MKKEIAETKLRRDLRVSLYSFLLYLAGMAAGFFVPRLGLFLYAGIPASYAISELVRRRGNDRAR
jgi:ABC-type multidrug transport system permease subunit